MLLSDVLTDAFNRVQEEVHNAVEGLEEKDLTYRPAGQANSIAWLVWHLTRIQDDHVSGLSRGEQVWTRDGWKERFGLPFDAATTGYGQSSDEVAQVRVDAEQLLGYYDTVHAQTVGYLGKLNEQEFGRVIDDNWEQPVTVAMRLVSVLSDDLQHVGQAAYVLGLIR